MATIIFSAIALGIIGASVVGLARYADRWRAEDPIAREGRVPPVFQQIGKAFMWFLLAALAVSVLTAIAGPYEDCILQNMKGIQAPNAANAIMRACKEKTTAKKCRAAELKARFVKPDFSAYGDLVTEKNEPTQSSPLWDQFALEQCLTECAAASYWSRTFGECKTD